MLSRIFWRFKGSYSFRFVWVIAAVLSLLSITPSSHAAVNIEAGHVANPFKLSNHPVNFRASTSRVSAVTTLNLDGVDDYVLVSNQPAFNPSGGITIEAWVRRNDADRCETIVGKDFLSGYWLGFCHNATLDRNVLRFYTNGGDSWEDGDLTIPAGRWTHIAVTFDGQERVYYIDGMRHFQGNSPGPLPVNGADLGIGADYDGDYTFSGNLAEIRLWSLARSQADIRRDMIRWINTSEPGLIAVWHFDGSAAEVFGNYPGIPKNGADFTGPAAPLDDYDPILIPRMSSASVDAVCSYGEYANTRLPIWFSDEWQVDGLDWVYLGATGTDLYLCLSSKNAPTGDIFRVYLDPDGDGGDLPQTNDYRFSIDDTGASGSERGIGLGLGGYVSPGPSNFEAAEFQFDFDWTAEFRIGRDLFPSPNVIFGMQVTRSDTNTYGWPIDYNEQKPDVWPSFQIIDADIPGADSANPTVRVSHAPTDIQAGDSVTIRAVPQDDVDVAQVYIYVDNLIAHSCVYNGDNDTTPASCDLVDIHDVGLHYYYAVVVDHRGRVGTTPLQAFFVKFVGGAPVVTLRYTPRKPAPGELVTIQVTATDPDGINEIEVIGHGALPGRRCEFSGSGTEETCSFVFWPPAGSRIVQYRGKAVDEEGVSALTPWHSILFGNKGLDSDDDGLVDVLEADLCTDPTNPDTDLDALLDGWELLGVLFEDGDFIDLPSLGANPCRKDIFLQLDYEAGLGFSDEEIMVLVNNLRRHGVTLHVEQNERPKLSPTDGCGPEDTHSEIGAVIAATLTDANGDYYFHPKRNWTHHYGYFRWKEGRSGAWGRYFTIDACAGTSIRNRDDLLGSRLIHELGHAIGFGHGGRRDSHTQMRNGDLIYYVGTVDHSAFKINYFSAMSYRYAGTNRCYDPSTRRWTVEFDFSDRDFVEVRETALDESFASDFASDLRAGACPAGFVPAFVYTCEDPDEFQPDGSNTRYYVISDGTQMLGRLRAGSGWQTTGLPAHPAGIDWNCDGVISSESVSENIDGIVPWEICDDVDNDGDGVIDEKCNEPWDPSSAEMIATRDYDRLPAEHSCNILRNADGSYRQDVTYRTLIGGVECPVSRGRALFGVQPIDEEEFLPLDLPNLEICDGINNDHDDEVDEGCPDTDADQIIDALDNCPATANPQQINLDGDSLGDACQSLSISQFRVASQTDTSLTLTWQSPVSDVLGFNLYRQTWGEGGLVFLGASYPSTTSTTFIDTITEGSAYLYILRLVNLNGQEGDEVTLAWGIKSIYMPLMLK